MKYIFTFFISLYSLLCISQVPLAEVAGRLSLYLPEDSTSVHIGKNAGINQVLTSRRGNTFVGGEAGFSNTIGNDNSFYGYRSGYRNTDGSENVFIGNIAGYSNKSGSQNCFVGEDSGYDNETGDYNVFIGNEAGYSNIGGSSNIYIGAFSGAGSQSKKNVIIGDNAGPNGDAMSSIFIGPNVGIGATNITDVLYIDNTGGDKPLIYGEFNNDLLTINGIQAISDNRTYQLLIDNPGTGGETWAIGSSNDDWPSGGGKLLIGTSLFSNNAFMAIEENGNVGIGTNTPEVLLDVDGDMRGINIETTGKFSVGTESGNWKAVIREAGDALSGSSVDVSNLAMMLEKQNPAPNEAVGLGFKSSSEDVDVGAAIIHERTSSFSQGKLHFATKTTGVSGGDIPIHMTIDDGGDVGIDEMNPEAKLHIGGPGKTFQFLIDNQGSGGQTWRIGSSNTDWNAGSGKLIFGTSTNSGAAHMTIESDGDIGIGITAPTEDLDIAGNVRIRNVSGGPNTNDIGISANGTLTTTSSDIRLKTNIKDFPNALDKVLSIRGVSFNWKELTDTNPQLGVIAQEVKAAIPEVVFENGGYLGVNYSQLSAVFIEAIKEQQQIIESQNQDISALKSQMTKRDQQYASILARMNHLETINAGTDK